RCWAFRRFWAFCRGDATSAFCNARKERVTSDMYFFFFLTPPRSFAGVPWMASASTFRRQMAYDSGSEPFRHPSTGSQLSVVHSSASLQFGVVPATQPAVGSQVSVPLQALLSLQSIGVPAHWPPPHVPPVVHRLPVATAQAVPFGRSVCWQPLGWQLSSVHGLPSSQFAGVHTTLGLPGAGQLGLMMGSWTHPAGSAQGGAGGEASPSAQVGGGAGTRGFGPRLAPGVHAPAPWRARAS